MLDSIEPSLLSTVVGGGLSLGDRNAPPPNPNSWAGPLNRATAAPPGLSATIDPGMTMKPANPTMDSGIWRQDAGSSGGASSGGGLDI
jgi:hypothetical protein